MLLLLVWVAFFATLKLQLVSGPLQGVVGQVLEYLPRLGAGLGLLLVAWIVATVARRLLAVIVRNLVTNLLAGAGVDRVGENAGLRGTMPLSRLVGVVLYALVLVPALNALQIAAITGPATEMLNAVMQAIPNVFAAAVILGPTSRASRSSGS